MTDLRKVYTSKYLKAADLGGCDHVVTIASESVERIQNKQGREDERITEVCRLRPELLRPLVAESDVEAVGDAAHTADDVGAATTTPADDSAIVGSGSGASDQPPDDAATHGPLDGANKHAPGPATANRLSASDLAIVETVKAAFGLDLEVVRARTALVEAQESIDIIGGMVDDVIRDRLAAVHREGRPLDVAGLSDSEPADFADLPLWVAGKIGPESSPAEEPAPC